MRRWKLADIRFCQKKTNEEIVEEIILEQYNQYYRLAYSYVHNEGDVASMYMGIIEFEIPAEVLKEIRK